MRIGIVGLGLIGGSLGLALRRLGGGIEVRGVAHHEDGVLAAQQRGAVDRASTDLREMSDCDIVVVATPINQVRVVFERLANVVRRGTIVTDVASVKRPVLEWATSVTIVHRRTTLARRSKTTRPWLIGVATTTM